MECFIKFGLSDGLSRGEIGQARIVSRVVRNKFGLDVSVCVDKNGAMHLSDVAYWFSHSSAKHRSQSG